MSLYLVNNGTERCTDQDESLLLVMGESGRIVGETPLPIAVNANSLGMFVCKIRDMPKRPSSDQLSKSTLLHMFQIWPELPLLLFLHYALRTSLLLDARLVTLQ